MFESRCVMISITGFSVACFLNTAFSYPNFANKYFFADYCTAEIAYVSGTNGTITWALNPAGSITTFGEDSNGELYTAVNSTIYKLIDSSLGLNDFNKAGLSFYPNPAKTELFLKSENALDLSSLKIIDLTGKIILQQNLNQVEINTITVSDFAKGMYLVEVKSLISLKMKI